jgi:chitodextrinase
MNKVYAIICLIGCAFFSLASPGMAATYPVKVGPTGRYLVDQNNQPFMIVGDSPQSLIGNLSQPQVVSYFADRAAHGFNSAWVNLLCDSYTACNRDGTTFDGIPPFTTPGDLSTPNSVYFARVDTYLNIAAAYGITVFLDPIETGGWLDVLRSNGVTKAFNYGVYLGNRYNNFPNIVWMSGNDFQTWQTASDDALVLAVVKGIKSVDPNHIHTAELNYDSSTTLDDPNWASLAGLNAAYTYYPTYAEVLHGYNQSPTLPTFLVEAHYEGENVGGEMGTPLVLRLQAYWTMLVGGAGQLYGNTYTWQFLSNWQSNLDTPGVTQLGYWNNLFSAYPWYNLLPDQNHTVVTAGYGTFSTVGNTSASNYMTTAYLPDGSLVMAYVPTIRTFTVQMTQLAGTVTAQWFDPTNGTYTTVPGSPFPNTQSQTFTTPGNNSAGDSDWILLLTASTNDTTPPTVPTNVSATAITPSQVSVTWSASTDNIGVAGYKIFRNGPQVGTSATTTFTDTGLAANTSYTYAVSAYDTAGNNSAESASTTVTTPTTTITLGETRVLSTDDSGNANLLPAQGAYLSQTGTLQSLSFYVTQVAGKLRLGVYDATGAGGQPGNKLAETNEITPVVGWNTATVTTPVTLNAGNYWLAYLPSDNNLHFVKGQTAGISEVFISYPYGIMPETFGTPIGGDSYHWSFYGTLNIR